jgi:hypothetical protein
MIPGQRESAHDASREACPSGSGVAIVADVGGRFLGESFRTAARGTSGAEGGRLGGGCLSV